MKALGGEVIHISATSKNHINAMDMTKEYGDGANPVILKSEFIMSLCEQLIRRGTPRAAHTTTTAPPPAGVSPTYQQKEQQGEGAGPADFRLGGFLNKMSRRRRKSPLPSSCLQAAA